MAEAEDLQVDLHDPFNLKRDEVRSYQNCQTFASFEPESLKNTSHMQLIVASKIMAARHVERASNTQLLLKFAVIAMVGFLDVECTPLQWRCMRAVCVC